MAQEELREMNLARQKWEQDYMEQLELSKRPKMSKMSADIT